MTTSTARRRIVMAVAAVVFVLADLALKQWAVAALPGRPISLGIMELRLAFNSGVAFGLGADTPTWVVLAITGGITVGLAVFAWREADKIALPGRIGLAAVLGGALGNVLDRTADGLVTDYFYTGWFATFNLADAFITCGAALLLLTTAFQRRPEESTPKES